MNPCEVTVHARKKKKKKKKPENVDVTKRGIQTLTLSVVVVHQPPLELLSNKEKKKKKI